MRPRRETPAEASPTTTPTPPEHIDAAVRGSLCIATEARLVRVRFVEYRFEEETAEGAITLDVTTWVLDSGPS